MAVEKNKKDIEENKMTAALSYVWILVFVPLFLKRDSNFVQFHAKQGLLLFAVEIVLGWIPIVNFFAIPIAVVLAIFGVKAAIDGKYWEMPILGKYAKQLNL